MDFAMLLKSKKKMRNMIWYCIPYRAYCFFFVSVLANFKYLNIKNKENKKLCSGQFLYPKPRQLCEYSDVAQPISVEPVTKQSPSYYRTLESDPRNHDEKHLGRIYTIPGMFCVKKVQI